MAKFESGVTYYTKYVGKVVVNFPEQEIACQYCPYCRSESELKRYWCRLTNEILYNPYSYKLGDNCPLRKDKE